MNGVIDGIFSKEFYWIWTGLSALTVVLSGLVNGFFGITSKRWQQVTAWVIGAILAVIAWYAQLLQVGEPVWLSVVTLAFCIGLSSNGVYDIPEVEKFIDKWFKEKPAKEQ